MCMRIHVYTHAHINVCIYTYTNVFMCVYMYIDTFVISKKEIGIVYLSYSQI